MSSFFEVRTVALARAPHTNNVIPSIATLPNGDLLTVWAATGGGPDQTVIVGALSHDCGRTWDRPVVIGDDPDRRCCDPAILVTNDAVIVMYMILEYPDPRPDDAACRYKKTTMTQRISTDNGRSWGPALPIDTGRVYSGSAAEGIVLKDGTLVWPFWWEMECELGRTPTENEMICISSVLISDNGGKDWEKGADVQLETYSAPGAQSVGADEPAIVELNDGRLYMLARTAEGQLFQAWSSDRGRSWTAMSPSALHSPGSPPALISLSRDPSKIVVVWNNAAGDLRFPLDIAISYDECQTWAHARTISNPGCEVSYPGVTVAGDGSIVVVYQQFHQTYFDDSPANALRDADIKCARLTEDWIKEGAFVSPRV